MKPSFGYRDVGFWRAILWRIRSRLSLRRRVEPGGPGGFLPPDAGMREPRRPLPISGSGAAALDEPGPTTN